MIVFAAVAWIICATVAGVFSPRILAWLKSPAAASEDMLQGLDLTSGFSTILSIALWGGTALAFPFIVYAILRFVFPALTNREKLVILSILRLAVWEIYYEEQVPDRVAISEALALTERYSGEEDKPFVNGILGTIQREKEARA